jgi:hypothetical protein
MMKTADYICERDRLIDTPVTLDGKAAQICGRLEQFATVCRKGDDWWYMAQWPWETAQAIVDRGGAFWTSDGLRRKLKLEERGLKFKG